MPPSHAPISSSRSLDVEWDSIGKDEDIKHIFWEGRRKYDNFEYEVCCKEKGKEYSRKQAKKDTNFMETDEDVTVELHEIKNGPSSPSEIIKEVKTRTREVQQKFHKAGQKDEIAARPFERGWCEEHRDWRLECSLVDTWVKS